MVQLVTEDVVYGSDSVRGKSFVGNVAEDVDRIYGSARHVHYVPPSELSVSAPEPLKELSSFSFDGKDIRGTVQCSYAVAGAWTVAARCVLQGEDGKEHMWTGWVFDIRDLKGQDKSLSEVPARFRFCFSRELVSSSSDFVASTYSDRIEKVAKENPNYVCIDGYVDGDPFVQAISSKYLSSKNKAVESAAEQALDESGLFEYQH